MPFQTLDIKPGILTEGSDREVGKAGYWKDCDHVRFKSGRPQKIGGWEKLMDDQFLGVTRAALDWRVLAGDKLLAFATDLKLYVTDQTTLYDITPLRDSGTLTDPFTTTNGSTLVSVADTGHGLYEGDFASFSSASAVGGITIDGTYRVTTITDADNYIITHSSAATSSAGPSGGSVDYEYEIHSGAAQTLVGSGWGAGTFGAGSYGTERSVTGILLDLRTWNLSNWGEDLIANYAGGGIYTWDVSGGYTTRAAVISGAPSQAQFVFVSSENRQLVALGAHDGTTFDPMLVRWSATEDYTDWTATSLNTAGDKRLDYGNTLYCALRFKAEYVIFSNSYVYSMTFVGPPDNFAFQAVGHNGGILGPHAAIEYNNVVYWMGRDQFYAYDGAIQVLPCSIHNFVFNDAFEGGVPVNMPQRLKVYAGVNISYGEVWWLYQSTSDTEIDRYVIYNTIDKSWTYGSLDRTVLVGNSTTLGFPYGFSSDSYIYQHETGTDDDGSALDAYIESGDVEIGEGDYLMQIRKFAPDVYCASGSVDLTLTAKKFPSSSETQTSGPHTFTSSTEFVNPRVRGRQISLKLESDAVGDEWRLGALRVDLVPHGKR